MTLWVRVLSSCNKDNQRIKFPEHNAHCALSSRYVDDSLGSCIEFVQQKQSAYDSPKHDTQRKAGSKYTR